jgi:hypothetical protein
VILLSTWAQPAGPTRKPAAASHPTTLDSDGIERVVTYLASPEIGGRQPQSSGHRKTLDFLRHSLTELGYEPEVLETASPNPLKGTIQNLLAGKPAARATGERCIALAAHYDHNPPMDGRYSPGAADNATGVATLLELARIARVPGGPLEGLDADLYFLFPDQEEVFIVGSHPLVKALETRCKQVLFSLTIDVLGAPFFPGFENRLLALGGDSAPGLARLLETTVPPESLTVASGGIFAIEPMGIPRSDYKSFRSEKIPFVFLTNGIPATYHTPDDTADKVDFGLVARDAEYLLRLLSSYNAEDEKLDFGFVARPKLDLRAEAEKVATILELMSRRPVENELEPADVAWLAARANELRTSAKTPTRGHIQGSVIRLIELVARRSPVPHAYLKSFFGKIF